MLNFLLHLISHISQISGESKSFKVEGGHTLTQVCSHVQKQPNPVVHHNTPGGVNTQAETKIVTLLYADFSISLKSWHALTDIAVCVVWVLHTAGISVTVVDNITAFSLTAEPITCNNTILVINGMDNGNLLATTHTAS